MRRRKRLRPAVRRGERGPSRPAAAAVGGAGPSKSARRQPPPSGGQTVEAPANGDAWVRSRSDLKHVEWSVGYVAFLAFTFAIITYMVPIGEAAMVVALIGVVFQRGTFRMPAPLVVFGLFVVWAAVGYFSTPYPTVVSEELTGLLKLWLIALVAVNVLRTRSQIRFYLVFFIACYALFPARGAIFNYFIYGYRIFGRALWNNVYGNPNDLAALSFLPLAIAAGLFVTERKGWVKLGAMASLFVIPLLILITQSRGAFLALIVVIALGFAGHKAFSDHRKLIRLATTGGLFAVLVLAIVPDSAWERFSGLSHATSTETLRSVDEEGSAQQRFDIWRTAADVIGDYPTTGVGIGAYREAHYAYALRNPTYPEGKRDAHSTYLSVLAETGYPGLLVFVSLLGLTFYRVERVRRKGKRLLPDSARQIFYLELGLVAYLLAGIFGSFALLSFLYIHLALIWVLAHTFEREIAILRYASRDRRRPRQRPSRFTSTGGSVGYSGNRPVESFS